MGRPYGQNWGRSSGGLPFLQFGEYHNLRNMIFYQRHGSYAASISYTYLIAVNHYWYTGSKGNSLEDATMVLRDLVASILLIRTISLMICWKPPEHCRLRKLRGTSSVIGECGLQTSGMQQLCWRFRMHGVLAKPEHHYGGITSSVEPSSDPAT